MHVIKDNPYRVLGVLSNSGAKAIVANQGKLKAFLKTNHQIDFPNDFVNILGKIERTEDSVNQAISAISLPKDKLVAGFFWFMSENSIDEIALNNLRNGDIDKAIDVQRKKKTVTACINLAVMYLLKEDWIKAIYYYAHLLNSKENRDELLSIIADNSKLMTEEETIQIFCKELLDSFPKVDWFTIVHSTTIDIDDKTTDIGGFIKDSNIGKYISSAYEEKVEKELDALLNKSKKSDNAQANLKAANTLKQKSHSLLHKMKLLFGKDNHRYKTYADKVANQILNLCIAYYNADEENPDRPRNVYNLTKYALRTAEGNETKERCQKNMAVIQEAYDALPPEEVQKESNEIDYLISNFQKQNNHFLLKACVQGCGNALEQIKTKLGSTNKFYIYESSYVVQFVVSVIVDEVNKTQEAYNDAPQYNDSLELENYKNRLKWAKPIMEMLANFAKDEKCAKRYGENKATLDSLYIKNCVQTSSYTPRTPLVGTSPSSSHPTQRPVSSYYTSQPKKENDNSGCVISVFLVIVVIVAIFCISRCNSSSSSSYNDTIYDEDTVAIDTFIVVDTMSIDDDYYMDNSVDDYNEQASSNLDVSESFISLGWQEQTYIINVYSTSSWWIDVGTAEWITPYCEGTTITLYVDSNPNEGSRQDYFVIKNDEGLTRRIDINQN